MEQIYTAEGSDWFWWYGADQNSGDDGSFDAQFRNTLARVYEIIGDPVPTFLKVPVIPQTAQPPAAGATGVISPTIDGIVTDGEWDTGGYYTEEGGVQANPNQIAEPALVRFRPRRHLPAHGRPAPLGRCWRRHARRFLSGETGRRQRAALQPRLGPQRQRRDAAGLPRQRSGRGRRSRTAWLRPLSTR